MQRAPLSLTSRLTAFFTLVAAAVVLGLGWLVMAGTERHFVELDQRSLQDKQRLIESILARARSAPETRARLDEALSHHHDLQVLVRGPQQEVLFQSPGFVPPAPLPASGLQHWQDGARGFHGLRWTVQPEGPGGATLEVVAALDTGHHTHFMDELRHTLTLYALAAVLCSGLLGWLAAYTGLAPLRAMRTRAASVTGQQLGPRMPVAAVPVEMADLALELNRMLDRLQADFQRLSEFSSDLAHELRTPISNLLTQTQVALSSPRSPAVYQEVLASNAEEFERLARMVSDMLFLAQTERGVELPGQTTFPAAQELRALIEFYEAVAEEKGIRLRLQGEAALRGERLMFRRAVSNLLSNALRHTPPGGEVLVQLTTTDAATEVVVENTGEDIAPEALPRLFDRFYRADAARAHPGAEGSGLGLSITRAIVEAHHGTVAVHSAGGRTRFGLSFPR